MPLLARTISRGPILAAFIAGIALASHRGAVADDTSAASAAAQKAAVEPQSFSPEQIAFFENKVRPILVENCYECHAGDEPKAQLRLVSRATILAGGESGPAITPGKPDDSLLVEAINYASFEMPPDGKLSDDKIATLTEWVRMGAPWPVETEGAVLVPRTHGLEITDEDRNYWAFVRSARPTLPRVSSPDWTRNRIDAFILAKLDERQLHPAPPVEPRELIRRAYLDLVGIPPTYEEIESLMADERPDSYERLLDQLLATPQYGERWGRHWLDVVRFGQTNGYERDDEKPESWRYRDYVIGALNRDKPYDRFVIEQLAGDQLDPATDDSISATAFYRLGVWDDEPDDMRQAEFDELDGIVSTMGSAFLGLTVGCARCHDHKFDPLPQTDYYRLLAFVRNIELYGAKKSDTHWGQNDDGILAELPSGAGKTLAVKERGGDPLATHVLVRGSAGNPGAEVEPCFPQVLSAAGAALNATPHHEAAGETSISSIQSISSITSTSAPSTGSRRLALAQWIAHRDNPLTSRVMANRLWQHHFGRGIVPTPSDFGKTGLPPSHPELLDWLAVELADGDWQLKRMHRLIMTSAAYRQSSRSASEGGADERGHAVDPDNTLVWRQNMRRLEAEAVRDSILAACGSMSLEMGGPSIFPTLPPEVLASQSQPGRGWKASPPSQQMRRSVYIFVKRTLGVPMLEALDVASPDSPVAQRTTTTVAPQALILLNSQFMQEQSQLLAERLMRDGGDDAARHIELAFQYVLSRDPRKRERTIATDYLTRQVQRFEDETNGAQPSTDHETNGADASHDPESKTPAGGFALREIDANSNVYRAALAAYCRLMLNLNEFVYID
jgi:hypothetical protein